MKKIIFVLVFGIFLILLFQIQIIFADAGSDDYSTDYHTGISGGTGLNSECNSEFAFMYQGTGNAENSEHNVNIGIFPQPLFCGDGICNNNENCDTCSTDCACASGYTCSAGVCVVITPPPVTPGGGGPGGGGPGAACTYDWVCSEWYPEPCPSDGIQKRVCVNRGTCAGTVRMPATIRTCVPEVIPPAEPLFDLFVKVPPQYKWILQGQAVGFDVELINVGNTTTIDVFFKYWIADEHGRLIAETQETRAVGERDKFRVRILLPEDLEKEIYKIYVQINYDVDKVAVAGDSFGIVASEFDVVFRKLISFPYILIPIAILLFFIFILILLLKRRRKRKEVPKKHKEKPMKRPKKEPVRIGFFERIRRRRARKRALKEKRLFRRKKKIKRYEKPKKRIKPRREIIRPVIVEYKEKEEKPVVIKPKAKKMKPVKKKRIKPLSQMERQRFDVEEGLRRKRLKELRKKIKSNK